MLTRRELLTRGVSAGAVAALLPSCLRARRDDGAAVPQALVETGEWVNDVHSQLNRTHVLGVEQPTSLEALQVLVRRAAHERRAVSICGGRHAMGGQQFGTDTLLIDLSSFHGVTDFDAERGQVEAGAGTRWPELIADLIERQRDRAGAWGIVQKQTGADGLSLGGSLSANVHGRGLVHRPLVQDVEAFTLVDARGEALRCSRSENSELFTLAIGGYGLFGVITSVRLRLSPRRKLRRVVEIADVKGLADRFADRIAHGFLYGDFQYSTDVGSEGLLRTGVFSCYEPVPDDTPIPEGQRSLSRSDWLDLLELSHENRAEAFRRYAAHYVSTSGQIGRASCRERVFGYV